MAYETQVRKRYCSSTGRHPATPRANETRDELKRTYDDITDRITEELSA
jgi:hypothetical protein